jgi:hypothetical protein
MQDTKTGKRYNYAGKTRGRAEIQASRVIRKVRHTCRQNMQAEHTGRTGRQSVQAGRTHRQKTGRTGRRQDALAEDRTHRQKTGGTGRRQDAEAGRTHRQTEHKGWQNSLAGRMHS